MWLNSKKNIFIEISKYNDYIEKENIKNEGKTLKTKTNAAKIVH
jgi:uncharacterized short protein YbdD (DUF466 family)